MIIGRSLAPLNSSRTWRAVRRRETLRRRADNSRRKVQNVRRDSCADFFTVEVWTATGLTRYVVLFVIELATRRVHIAGIASEPDSAWVVQCGRQLTDAVDGFLVGKRFLLPDRDSLFTEAFRETLATTGVETVRLPPKSPNLNAFAERFVRSIKESCLNPPANSTAEVPEHPLTLAEAAESFGLSRETVASIRTFVSAPSRGSSTRRANGGLRKSASSRKHSSSKKR